MVYYGSGYLWFSTVCEEIFIGEEVGFIIFITRKGDGSWYTLCWQVFT